MKKIIPFKKELPFKTKISEISSISLEHTLEFKESDLISGVFFVSGDYKMTDTSINKEAFNYEIPFDIALDSRFDINNIKLDIDDFYYEIINDDTLKVNIDVFIEGAEIEEERCIEEEIVNEEVKEEVIEKSVLYNDNLKEELNIDERDDLMDNENEVLEEKVVNNINMFDNINNTETYSTYFVYIVKEDDNLDKILEKFKISKEELLNYNDITELRANDKIIIPTCNE